MRKKIKLSEMETANGKSWDGEESLVSLTQSNNPYLKCTKAEYEKVIRGMNSFDLFSHASTVMVPLRDNRELLIKKLLEAFPSRK